MPCALQYGMSANEFWYGDTRLFLAYKKAYLRNMTYNAWIIGNYNRISVEIGAKNALMTKKSEHIDNWIDYQDPIEKLYKLHKKENYEVEHRNQQMWFYNMINN